MLRRLLMMGVLASILAVVGFAPALAKKDGKGGKDGKKGDETSQTESGSGGDDDSDAGGDDDSDGGLGGLPLPDVPGVPNVLPNGDDEDEGFGDSRDAAGDQYGGDDDDDDGKGKKKGKGRNKGDDDDDDDDDDDGNAGTSMAWVACFTPPGGSTATAPICFPCPPPYLNIPLTDPRSHPLCATAVPTTIRQEQHVPFTLRNLGTGEPIDRAAASSGRMTPLTQVAAFRETAGADSSEVANPAAAIRTASPAGLPFTGVNVLLLVLLGSMLLALGLALRAADRLKGGPEGS